MSLSSVEACLNDFLNAQSLLADTPVFVGLSGGLDSCVLLAALAQNKPSTSITAIHINHGLQADAKHFQAHCEVLCKHLKIKLVVKNIQVEAGASVEGQARKARFNAFSELLPQGAPLFLAHHQDDQIETFFMRLMRGSGLKGLTGMADIQPFEHFFLLRPFLNLSKQTLKDYACSQNLDWVEDTTNEDTHFKRNHIRHHLLGYIQQNYADSKDAMSRSIEQLKDDYDCLQSLVEPYLKNCVEEVDYPYTAKFRLNIEPLSGLELNLQSLIIRQWLSRLGLYAPNQMQLAEIQSSLIGAKADSLPEYQYQSGCLVRHQGALYWIQKAPTPKPTSFLLNEQSPEQLSLEALIWADAHINVSHDGHIRSGSYHLCAASQIECRELKIRKRGTKSFKQLFQEAKIPPWLRANWPVLLENSQPVALVGLAIAESVYSQDGWSLSYATFAA